MARTVNSIIMTSCDDCRVTLQHCKPSDLPLLREALAECDRLGDRKTVRQHIARRIKKLEKEDR